MLSTIDEDIQFFLQHPDRQARIRKPRHKIDINAQRAAGFTAEMQAEFRFLGPHDKSRRRVIIYRVPPNNPMYDDKKPQLLKIPVLLFADEEIADRDDILLPEIHRIMEEQRQHYAAEERKKGYSGL